MSRLVELGVVEKQGHGKGSRYYLSRRFYTEIGKRGAYTRRRGLDRQANKELLLRHLTDHRDAGSPMSELQQVLVGLSRNQVRKLLVELRDEGRVRLKGHRRGARWYIKEEL